MSQIHDQRGFLTCVDWLRRVNRVLPDLFQVEFPEINVSVDNTRGRGGGVFILRLDADQNPGATSSRNHRSGWKRTHAASWGVFLDSGAASGKKAICEGHTPSCGEIANALVPILQVERISVFPVTGSVLSDREMDFGENVREVSRQSRAQSQ